MASEEPQKKPGKFGLMMKSMGASTKKGMKRAGKQMKKGAVKAKQKAAEKIIKAPTSEQEPEVIEALEKLKISKNEMYAASDVSRNLYEARLEETTFLCQLGDKLSSVKPLQNDPFATYVNQMGKSLHQLGNIKQAHIQNMLNQFVVPLEEFRDVDVEEVQSTKLNYKNSKIQFDLAAHKLTKVQDSTTSDNNKINDAQQKKDAKLKEFNEQCTQIKIQVNNLEEKKQIKLLDSMESYWLSFARYSVALSNILSNGDISSTKYQLNTEYNHDNTVTPMDTTNGMNAEHEDDVFSEGNDGYDEIKQNDDNGGVAEVQPVAAINDEQYVDNILDNLNNVENNVKMDNEKNENNENAGYQNGDLDLNQNDNDEQNKNINQNDDNNNNANIPKDNEQNDEEYEYYEEEENDEQDNGPTDDYNPFE